MINENIKEDIRRWLWAENEIHGTFRAISDIQLAQRNMLVHEWDVRSIIAGATKASKDELQQLGRDNMPASDAYLDSALKKSDTFIVNKYFEFLNQESVDNIIDGWDFVFNINTQRQTYFRQNFDKIFKDNMSKYNSRKIMLIGNHDNEKFDKFYLNYFDELRYFVYQFDDNSNELIVFTHEPITTKNLNLPRMATIKDFVKNYNGDIKIKNIYWHTHSKEINPAYDWEVITRISQYENMCIDYKILNGLI